MKEKRESYMNYIEKLEGEYREKFELADSYCEILLDGVDLNTKEEIMSSILDSFFSAQNENTSVQKVIGTDIAKFCENACSEIPFKYRIKHIVKVAEVFSWIAIVDALEKIIILLIEKTLTVDNILNWKINSNIFLIFTVSFIIATLYIIYRKNRIRNELRKEKINDKVVVGNYFYIIIIGFIATGIVSSFSVFIDFRYEISIWIVLGVSILLIAVSKIVYRNDSKYDMDMTDSIINEVIKSSEENFKEENEKRVKKGKSKLTEEQYLDLQIKNCKKYNNRFKIATAIYFIITLPFSLLGETITDKLIILGMFLIVFIFIEIGSYVLFRKGLSKFNKEILEKYIYFKENNISMKDWK